MKILHFHFFKLLEFKVLVNLRVSLWQERNVKYLMPCEFTYVLEGNGSYAVKVNALDPEGYLADKLVGQKFHFGNPGKIIGYGVLLKIDM